MIYLQNNTSAQTISIPYTQPTLPVHKKVQEVKDYSVSEGGQFIIEPDSGYTSMGRVDLNVDIDTQEIYNSGYTSGYTDGYTSGTTDGWNNGFDSGYTSGYTDGYGQGEQMGYDEAADRVARNSVGLTISANGQYNATITEEVKGYISAVTVNVDESQAYQSGYTDGYRQGEQIGYNEAADAADRYSVGLTISANGQYNATITEQVKGYISGVSVNVAAAGKLPSIIDGSINEPITIADLSGITKVRNYGFAYLSNVPSIELPNTVRSIGNYAFYYCENTTSITINSGVTTIGTYAFNGCTNLVDLKIPEGVTSIDGYAFGICRSLTQLVLPSTLTSMNIKFDNYNGGLGWKNLYLKSPNKVSLSGTYGANYIPIGVTMWVPADTISAYTADSNWSRIIFEKSWEIKPMVDSIGFADVEWVKDVPRSGGIADRDNCSFKVYGYVSGETPIDITSACTIDGSTIVPAYTGNTRHQAGTLTLTATYGIYSATTQVTIWQTADYIEVSPTIINITSGGVGSDITINGNSTWTASGIPSYIVMSKLSGDTFPDTVNVGAQPYSQGELRSSQINFVSQTGYYAGLQAYQMPEIFTPYVHLNNLNGNDVNSHTYTTYCINTGIHASADIKFRLKGKTKGYGGMLFGYSPGLPGCSSDSKDWRFFWYSNWEGSFLTMDINSNRYRASWAFTDGQEIDLTYNGTSIYDNINETTIISNINGNQTPQSPDATIWLSLHCWWFKEVEIEQNNQVVFHGVAVDGGVRDIISGNLLSIPNLVYEN